MSEDETPKNRILTPLDPARLRTRDGCYVVDGVKYGSKAYMNDQTELRFSKGSLRENYRKWVGKPVIVNHDRSKIIGMVSDAMLLEQGGSKADDGAQTVDGIVSFKLAISDDASKEMMEKNPEKVGVSVETEGPKFDLEGYIVTFDDGSYVSLSLPSAGTEGFPEGGLREAGETFSDASKVKGEKMVEDTKSGGKMPTSSAQDNNVETAQPALKEVIEIAQGYEKRIREQEGEMKVLEEKYSKEITELRSFKENQEKAAREVVIKRAEAAGIPEDVYKDLPLEKVVALTTTLEAKMKSMPPSNTSVTPGAGSVASAPKTAKEVHAAIKAAEIKRLNGTDEV